jgi:starch phosphorylase
VCADYLRRPLPPELQPLAELSLDMRLTGSQLATRIWESLDPEAWERSTNPFMILQNAHQDKLDAAASDESLKAEWSEWLARWRRYIESPGWFGETHSESALKGVAYFSMEFGLGEALPIYSGGLGILAGDHMKSASDLNVPVVGVGLLYQQGYFRQVLAQDGWQLEALPFNDPGSLPVTPVFDEDGRWPRVRLNLPGRTLFLRVWQVQIGKVKLYLLDSNHPLNSPWDRGITANLYAAGKDNRLLQEIVLGVGGWRLLEKLGLDVQVCHLNEGHAAFAVLARAKSFADKHSIDFRTAFCATRAGNVFTTHTPVEAAFDKFDPAMLAKYAQPTVEEMGLTMRDFLALGRRDPNNDDEPFNMAYLAMRGACHVNGVARLHGQVSKRLFNVLFPYWPEVEVPVGHVTNGVHVPTWDSAAANNLWSDAYQGEGYWANHMEKAAEAVGRVDDEQIWDFRAASRKTLVAYVRKRFTRQIRESGASEELVSQCGHVLDPNVLTLGFARRFTAYKRPNLVLHDAERFANILKNNERPVQFIVAGKAHPNDDDGKRMIRAMAQFSWREDVRDRVIFLEDYDIALAQNLAAGIDVWLNNPRRPAEACGTSGMKMVVNGGLHFSTLDGWWDEAYSPEVGWALGDDQEHGPEHDASDALQLYDMLEQQIVPEFYDRDQAGAPRAWIARIRASMTTLTARFSSERMVRDYVEQAYLPAAQAFLIRSKDNAKVARQIESWRQSNSEGWQETRFGEVRVEEADGQFHFEVQAYLGDVPDEAVRVELFAEPPSGEAAEPIVMERIGPIHGAVNGFRYAASVPANRAWDDFTARLVPYHPNAFVPLEDTHIRWAR